MVVYAPAQIISAPAQFITAPAQLITVPAQPPATGAVVYTALFNISLGRERCYILVLSPIFHELSKEFVFGLLPCQFVSYSI